MVISVGESYLWSAAERSSAVGADAPVVAGVVRPLHNALLTKHTEANTELKIILSPVHNITEFSMIIYYRN